MKTNPNHKILESLNFFDIQFSEQMLDDYPILIDTYLSYLFRSTLPILDKISLVNNCSHSKASISNAISILENHYFSHLFPRRNKELQEYIQQRMDSS